METPFAKIKCSFPDTKSSLSSFPLFIPLSFLPCLVISVTDCGGVCERPCCWVLLLTSVWVYFNFCWDHLCFLSSLAKMHFYDVAVLTILWSVLLITAAVLADVSVQWCKVCCTFFSAWFWWLVLIDDDDSKVRHDGLRRRSYFSILPGESVMTFLKFRSMTVSPGFTIAVAAPSLRSLLCYGVHALYWDPFFFNVPYGLIKPWAFFYGISSLWAYKERWDDVFPLLNKFPLIKSIPTSTCTVLLYSKGGERCR